MIELNRVIKRKLTDVDGHDYRVEISPFGIAIYKFGGRSLVAERSWESLVRRSQKSAAPSKKRSTLQDRLPHIVQRIWLELDTIREDVRELRNEKRKEGGA